MHRSNLVPYVNGTDPEDAVLHILYVDEPLSLFEQHVVLQGVVQWDLFYETAHQTQLPETVLAARAQSESAFALALLMFMITRGIPLSRQALVVEPACDPATGLAIVHAIRAMTSQFPLAGVRWITDAGRPRKIAPVLRNLEHVHASMGGGPSVPMINGLIALMRLTLDKAQPCVRMDLPRFERALSALVPVFMRLRGRCMPQDVARAFGDGAALEFLVRSLSNAPVEEALVAQLLSDCGPADMALSDRCDRLATLLRPLALVLAMATGSACSPVREQDGHPAPDHQ